MTRGFMLLCLLLLLPGLIPEPVRAQEPTAETQIDLDDLPPIRRAYNGLSWGYTRTFWSKDRGDEGYAQAGTAGPTVGLRLWRPMGARMGMSPYIQYLWMHSTTSTLVRDGRSQAIRTERTAYRELDLGLNFDYALTPSGEGFYFGAGPMVRWGQAGRREFGGDRSGLTRKATWFGVTLLAGYRSSLGNSSMAFFEPQFIISPDLADRWQDTYPPENLSLMMGILW